MKKTKRYQTNLISSIIVLVMLVLFVLLGIMLINHTKLETRFDAIISMLERIDKAVANLDTEREILVCIAALYIAKCQLPIPLSFLCVISGMVFPIREALLINIAGIMFSFCVKYFEGMWIGGGWAGMILNIKQMRFIRDWIQFKGNGNPYVLPLSRLVPIVPLGMVSKYYGSLRYDFVYYCLLSLLGFFPRLYIYTRIGAEIKNPFSPRFIIMVMILVGFVGITSLCFNIFYGIKSNQMNKTLLIFSEKEKYKIVL